MRYKKIGNQGHFFNTTVYREESCIFKYIQKWNKQCAVNVANSGSFMQMQKISNNIK